LGGYLKMRAVLRTTHRWLGLLLVIPMLVQGVTGAILAIEPMTEPTRGTAIATASIDDIVTAAKGVATEELHAIRYVPGTTVTPAEVWFAPASSPRGRGTLMVRVDPTTVTPIWPPETPDGPMSWVHRIHGNFLLADFGGRSIVGWVGVGLVLLCVMGVPIWWPSRGQWRAAFTFSSAAQGYPFHRRLHGAAGIWAVVLLLVFGATGAVLGFPRTIRDVLGVPGDGLPRSNWSGAAAPSRKLDAALALASGQAPGTVLRMMFLPAGTGGPIRVVLAPPGETGAASMTTVTVDGSATRVLGVQSARTMAPVELMLRRLRDIHYGVGLSGVWRVFAIAAGLALPIFAVTGTAMWLLRTRYRKRAGVSRAPSLSVGE
jgi:uncharacterized iron-regulated membrane protein